MSNLIAKAARYLRREYPKNTCIGIIYAGASVFFAMMPYGGPAFIPIIGFCLLVGTFSDFADKRPKGNCAWINGVKLVGDTRDIASAHQMQKLITGYTKKLQHMKKLPSEAQDKIAAHLADIEPGLKNLRMYDAKENPVSSFPFTRKMYDPAGQLVEQTVASISSNFAVPAPAPAPTSINLTGLRDALKKAVQPAANADMNPTPADKAAQRPRKSPSPLKRARKMRQRTRKFKPTV